MHFTLTNITLSYRSRPQRNKFTFLIIHLKSKFLKQIFDVCTRYENPVLCVISPLWKKDKVLQCDSKYVYLLPESILYPMLKM